MHRATLVGVLAVLLAQILIVVPASAQAAPSLTGFALYPHLRGDCVPDTAPRTWFPNSVAAIYWAATFAGWNGLHSYRVEWLRPNGWLYDSEGNSAAATGTVTWCNREFIAGFNAARRRGVWQVRVYLDGQLRRVARFHLYGPDPRKTHVVRLRSVRLYADMNDRRCDPTLRPRSVFYRSMRSIDYRLDFLDWEGKHTYHVAWIRPDGLTYDSQDYTGTNYGGVAFCDGELIRGEDAATYIGRWRLQVSVDGRFRRVVPFTLVRR